MTTGQDDDYARTPGDTPDFGNENDEFGYGAEQTGTANTAPDESVPTGQGAGGREEGDADEPPGPVRV